MDHIGNGGDGSGGDGTAVGLLAGVPGRDLQAALARIDPHALSGSDLALVIRAQARCLACIQAAMAATITEFVHCPAWTEVPTARVEGVQEFACDELALLLHVAPMTGKNLVLGSVDLVERHPRLWAALSDGFIDMRKVAAVTTTCPDTDDVLAAAVDDALLNTAVRPDGSTALEQTIAEPPGALRVRTQRTLSALDPSWVRATRREALSRRRVAKGSYGMGVGYLGLYDIAVPEMAAAYEHVNAIARGIKHLGDTRTLDQLRADTALDLLTGGHSAPVFTPKPPTRTPREAPATARDNATNPADGHPNGQERSDNDAATARSDTATATATAAGGEERPDEPSPAHTAPTAGGEEGQDEASPAETATAPLSDERPAGDANATESDTVDGSRAERSTPR